MSGAVKLNSVIRVITGLIGLALLGYFLLFFAREATKMTSLRTAVGMGSALDELVARVNNLIHRNTPPEQFITFFVSIYDSKTSQLTYVNAGHNPPMLLRQNGEPRALDKGGLILGCLPAMRYEQETLTLRADDLIIMYTDGVSEATNAKDEMFGDQGICDFVCTRQTQPVKQILSALENEVVQFRGEDTFDDDFTLLLMRVV